jgi:putative transcriptional regulator
MAIVVNLDELLYARRMTLTELADRVGITLANLSILKTGKAKAIRFSTLDAICRQLGCQPGDLLAFNADGAPSEEKLATDAREPASRTNSATGPEVYGHPPSDAESHSSLHRGDRSSAASAIARRRHGAATRCVARQHLGDEIKVVALAARDRIRDHELGIAIHFSGIDVGHAELDATA